MSFSVSHKKNNVSSSSGKKQQTFFLFKFSKTTICVIVIAVSFLILAISACSGSANYFDMYLVDAKAENKENIDVDQDLKIIFNQPVIFLNFDNIDIKPSIDFDFNLSDNNKVLVLSHNKLLLNETKYEVHLKNVRGLSGLSMGNKKFVFYTRSEIKDSKIVERSEKEFFSEPKLSKDKYIVPEISKPKKEIEIVPKFTEGKYIDISISDQVMTIFEDGVKVNSFLISSGKRGMSTPLGTYAVKKKEPKHWSSSYGLWMPFSMNFHGAYYIHELPYWPSGYREGEDHLGIRVSHGCIRLGVGPAEYVFDWAEIGTPIYIHN